MNDAIWRAVERSLGNVETLLRSAARQRTGRAARHELAKAHKELLAAQAGVAMSRREQATLEELADAQTTAQAPYRLRRAV